MLRARVAVCGRLNRQAAAAFLVDLVEGDVLGSVGWSASLSLTATCSGPGVGGGSSVTVVNLSASRMFTTKDCAAVRTGVLLSVALTVIE